MDLERVGIYGISFGGYLAIRALLQAHIRAFFLVTRSTRAQPPVVELRRADGTLLQTISEANIDGLKDLKWTPPEGFVVKAADGKTDL